MRHHVVFLEAANAPCVDFAFPHTYHRHTHTQAHEVAERIKDATIVVVGVTPVTAEHLDQAPYLQCLAITATGFEWLDRGAFAERGITVVNCPQNNVEAVGEHFLALYFSARKKTVEVHNAVTGPDRQWIQEGSLTPRWKQGPPLSCRQETLGIIGYGALGRQIEVLATGVGFSRVLIAERKGQNKIRGGRVLFEELIRDATTIVVCCPKEPSTLGLISEPELLMMKQEALLLNLSRGGIVCERALAAALKEGRIFGAATDVLETEPGGIGTTPLIPDVANGEEGIPNLTITSHVAWFSQQTMENLGRFLKLGIEGCVMDSLSEPSSRGTVIIHKGEVWR
ncbi:Glycerate dehydrogenase [Tolypocladium paradoxum]|uniref:Glycerate dehydrogenase n=1 Tax=Tolypocladium paradoxum TaxID=94208 RepID=A0A2S4L7A0_9HYPO|nr:Glycerate dehydrogenase [Tolypocladium paradoxum]